LALAGENECGASEVRERQQRLVGGLKAIRGRSVPAAPVRLSTFSAANADSAWLRRTSMAWRKA
jgi:hypothetical protein